MPCLTAGKKLTAAFRKLQTKTEWAFEKIICFESDLDRKVATNRDLKQLLAVLTDMHKQLQGILTEHAAVLTAPQRSCIRMNSQNMAMLSNVLLDYGHIDRPSTLNQNEQTTDANESDSVLGMLTSAKGEQESDAVPLPRIVVCSQVRVTRDGLRVMMKWLDGRLAPIWWTREIVKWSRSLLVLFTVAASIVALTVDHHATPYLTLSCSLATALVEFIDSCYIKPGEPDAKLRRADPADVEALTPHKDNHSDKDEHQIGHSLDASTAISMKSDSDYY